MDLTIAAERRNIGRLGIGDIAEPYNGDILVNEGLP